MKKLRFFIFAIIIACCVAALAGCGQPKLSKPVGLSVNETTLVLSWRKITDARRYKLSINGTERDVRENSYSLNNLEAGEYKLMVKAVGDGETVKDSDWSEEITFVREAETGLVFTLRNKTEYEVTGLGTAIGDVVIPETYRGKPVTSIGNRAFYNRARLTGIVIGSNVKKIGDRAFANCSLLTKITLPEGLESIGAYAFQSCKLLSGEFTVPEKVTQISDNAFEYCRLLTGIKMGTNVTSIGKNAFAECENLKNIEIPDGVVSIGEGAFYGCAKAEKLTVGRSVTSIGKQAFYGCSALTSVTFNDRLETIGDNAFDGCALITKVTLPDTVKEIGAAAFIRCSALADVRVGSGVEKIGATAFYHTALWENAEEFVYAGDWFVGTKNVERATFLADDFKQGTVGIAANAFNNCKVMYDVVLPDTVRYINTQAFHGCEALVSVVIGGGVVRIDDYSFNDCKVLSAAILGSYDRDNPYGYKQSSLQTIGSYVFRNCERLEEIRIPSTVTSIGTRAFDNSGLFNSQMAAVYADKWIVGNNESMNVLVEGIKDDTVGIANYSFYNAKNLNSNLVIPDSVVTIGRGAFYGSNTLALLTLPQGLKRIEDYTFYNCKLLALSKLPSSLESIGRSAFYGCQVLGIEAVNENTEVIFNIPDSVKTIGDYAFYGCGISTTADDGEVFHIGITTLNIGNGVQQIGRNAFANMIALRQVNIGNGVKTVGDRAFANCEVLEAVNFGSGITEISERMFYNCVALKSVSFPANIKTVGNYAFYKCENLAEVDFGSVENIGDYSFYGASFKTLRFPASVKNIGRQAFRNCKNLVDVYITSDIEKIDSHAFYGCDSLTVYSTLNGAPEGWSAQWNSSFRPVIWGVTLADEGYLLSFVKSQTAAVNVFDKNAVSALRKGYALAGFTTVRDGTAVEFTADRLASVPEGTTLYAVWTEGEPAVPSEPEEAQS